MRFNSKIPNWNYKVNKALVSNKGGSNKAVSSRRHYDSSSDSSDDEQRNNNSYNITNKGHNSDPRYALPSSRLHSTSTSHNRNAHKGHNYDRHEGEDDQFNEYERTRLRNELDSIQPINTTAPSFTSHFTSTGTGTGGMSGGMGGSLVDKASKKDLLRADVTPLAIDPGLDFASVGGLDNHIAALKEMVLLPLLYPQVFTKFQTEPPRGVLFTGPPGQ